MAQSPFQFDPPANLSDFNASLRQGWSQFIADAFQSNIQGILDEFSQGGASNPVIQFYSPLETQTPASFQTLPIVWNAFPNVANNIFADERSALRAVEEPIRCVSQGNVITYRPQDEYCEWHVKRDAAGKIKSVTFTCEGPEYWEFLAQNDSATLLSLYRQYVDPSVQMNDLLLPSGQYNRFNKWNTKQGIMHLTHPANKLGAEINIAAQATILRKTSDGQPVTDASDLICCALFGEPQRFSDPTIGHSVNELAQQGFLVTLKNPVGLYMQGLNTVGWTTPDGSDAQRYWKVLRGDASQGMTVRAVYEVPDSANFTVSDIKINNVPIEFGGQITKQITMSLTGIAFQPTPPLDTTSIPMLACLGAGPVPGCPGGQPYRNLCEVSGGEPQIASLTTTAEFAEQMPTLQQTGVMYGRRALRRDTGNS
jgi:hypothetical protein